MFLSLEFNEVFALLNFFGFCLKLESVRIFFVGILLVGCKFMNESLFFSFFISYFIYFVLCSVYLIGFLLYSKDFFVMDKFLIRCNENFRVENLNFRE